MIEKNYNPKQKNRTKSKKKLTEEQLIHTIQFDINKINTEYDDIKNNRTKYLKRIKFKR
ncbi:hypothetical protein [Methanosphaera sp. DEW79]|uniref:hypothetical protein n=1 Tax=Methanosphaera sp. DEW79 TaxID=1945576 RepID=UPI00257FF379|nr:hypothetical protein [Methanosphaera sp. DEW79]